MSGTRRDYSAEGGQEWGTDSTREEGEWRPQDDRAPLGKDRVYKKDIPKWGSVPEWVPKGVVGYVTLVYGGRGSVLARSLSRLRSMCTLGSSTAQDRVSLPEYGKEEERNVWLER